MDTDKHKTVEQLIEERRLFEATLDELSDEQMTVDSVIDNWTVKDILAHVTAWEVLLLEWIDMAYAGHSPDMPEPGQWTPYIEKFNRANYLENLNKPLAEVRQNFDQVYEKVLEAFRSLPEEDEDPLWHLWYNNEPPWILFRTFPEHYEEHRRQIAARFQ